MAKRLKLDIYIPCDPVFPLSGTQPISYTYVNQKACTRMLTAALFITILTPKLLLSAISRMEKLSMEHR